MVCVGDQCVSVIDLKGVARLIGVDFKDRVMLSPAELSKKLIMVIDACCRYVRQVSTEQLTHSQIDRPNRTFRSLGIHAIQMGAAFLDSLDTGRVDLRGRKLPENAAEEWTGREIAAFGAEIRREVDDWWQRSGTTLDMDTPIENDWGVQTRHQSMERQTWHAAQHVRQLIMFLDQLEITPDGRLSAEDLKGLPLPENVWI